MPILLFALYLIVWVWCVFWANDDATRRGSPAIFVALVVALIPWPFGLIIWLVLRPPLLLREL